MKIKSITITLADDDAVGDIQYKLQEERPNGQLVNINLYDQNQIPFCLLNPEQGAQQLVAIASEHTKY